LRPLDLSIPEPENPPARSTRVDTRPDAAQTNNVPAAASSVASPTRHGLWGNVGIGFGSLGCRDCGDSDRYNGLAGDFAVGGTLSPRLRLGFGSSGWTRSTTGSIRHLGDVKATTTVSTLDARVRFYPKISSGFFVTGGLGLGMLSDRVSQAGTKIDSLSATSLGGGAVLGIGWDINMTKHFSLTPSYTGFAMQSSTLDRNVGQIGLGITIH